MSTFEYNNKADYKPQGKMFFFQENLAEDGSKKRTDADDYTYVRSVCIIDGDVFKKLIKNYSKESCQ